MGFIHYKYPVELCPAILIGCRKFWNAVTVWGSCTWILSELLGSGLKVFGRLLLNNYTVDRKSSVVSCSFSAIGEITADLFLNACSFFLRYLRSLPSHVVVKQIDKICNFTSCICQFILILYSVEYWHFR